jgi:hypothetical protein
MAICLSHLCLLPTPYTAMRRTPMWLFSDLNGHRCCPVNVRDQLRKLGIWAPCRLTDGADQPRPVRRRGCRAGRRVHRIARPCDPASVTSFGEPSRLSCHLEVRTPSLVPASPIGEPNSPPDGLPPPDDRPRRARCLRHQLIAVGRRSSTFDRCRR